MPHAVGDGVVRDFRALVCWRLSHDLKCEVFDFTETGRAARDYKYRDQIRDSSASAPANIAEGFGRFVPAEFAQYLKYARASLTETQNHLIDGHERRYLSDKQFSRLSSLAGAALKTTTNLMRSKQRQADQERRRKRANQKDAGSVVPRAVAPTRDIRNTPRYTAAQAPRIPKPSLDSTE